MPMTVSPGRGSGEPNAARSALMLPTTATPLRLRLPSLDVQWLAPARGRADPLSSSAYFVVLADDGASLLAPRRHGEARDPVSGSLPMAERMTVCSSP